MNLPPDPPWYPYSIVTLSLSFLVIHALISLVVGLVFQFVFKFSSALKASLLVALIDTVAYILFSLPPKFGFYWSQQHALAGVLGETAILVLVSALVSVKATKVFTRNSVGRAFILWAANFGVLFGVFWAMLADSSWW